MRKKCNENTITWAVLTSKFGHFFNRFILIEL